MSKPLNLYSFALPIHTNNGGAYVMGREAFKKAALELAGGYTLPNGAGTCSIGLWRNPEGRDCRDLLEVVNVACDALTRDKLEGVFWREFPDQEALYVAKIGEADIIARPADEAPPPVVRGRA